MYPQSPLFEIPLADARVYQHYDRAEGGLLGKRKNGQVAAITLLCALAVDKRLSIADAMAKTDLPRSSLYRTCRSLQQGGFVKLDAGEISIGPAATRLAQGWRQQCEADFQQRSQRDRGVSKGMAPLPHTPKREFPSLSLSAPQLRRKRRFQIGFSNAALNNPWRTALLHAVEYGAGGLGDAVERLYIRDALDSARLQARQIDELIEAGVDGLLVSAAQNETVKDRILAAIAGGIRVVLVDRFPLDPIPGIPIVTSSNHAIGRTTALWLAEVLSLRGNILLLAGKKDTVPGQERLDAARDVFAKFPNIKIAAIHWSDWNADRAEHIVTGYLAQSDRPFDGIWCDSGLQGVGSFRAYLAAARRGIAIVPHTGGDLNLSYKLALQNKVPLGAVDYPPAMGMVAIEMLHTMLTGGQVPMSLSVRSDVILTSDTASVKATIWAEDHVKWDMPDELILHAGLGDYYNPRAFRITYPGNVYHRSAAQLARVRNTPQ